MPREDWSEHEVEIVVADYLRMLLVELRRENYNKAEANRRLQQLLPARGRASIEFKHQNISAVMTEMNWPCIAGYKPRWHYQELLREVVLRQALSHRELASTLARIVQSPPQEHEPPADILATQVAPPQPTDKADSDILGSPLARALPAKNYLEIEARNQLLGRSGEDFVMKFEHVRLWRAGQRRLADKIEHVARTRGDGWGFDIMSFEADGRERLVEVKTTRFGAYTPFFASKNELDVSEVRGAAYHVYRVFDFARNTRLFVLPGPIRSSCTVEPVEFKAMPA